MSLISCLKQLAGANRTVSFQTKEMLALLGLESLSAALQWDMPVHICHPIISQCSVVHLELPVQARMHPTMLLCMLPCR